MTHSCPSCAASLDEEGICTSCGALTRGFFRGLDLGAPQLAAAVANGLDFYLLLGVAPTADVRSIARRYRQLRVVFPDDPTDLAPEPARRLELLELAGRTLTDPRLRHTYDQLRATPAAEPVDYYAMLGLNAEHLMPALSPPPASFQQSIAGPALAPRGGPATSADIDAAALARERQILLAPGYAPEERDERVNEIEIARRILRDDPRRSHYDMLLLDFRQGLYGGGRLDALQHLQDLARADLAESRGEQISSEEGAALLKQGLGYLDARLPREAIDPLRRAVAALPRSAEALQAYVRALLESDDPLALGSHALRQLLKSLDALAGLGVTNQNLAALAALCRGLLARDEGDTAIGAAELQRAVDLDHRLAPAWRGLAALSLSRGATEAGLGFCRRALAIDPRDERTLLMLIAPRLRAGLYLD